MPVMKNSPSLETRNPEVPFQAGGSCVGESERGAGGDQHDKYLDQALKGVQH